MPTLSTITLQSSTTPNVSFIIPINEATFAQAIEWMNAPASITERLDRKYALHDYLGAFLKLKDPVPTPSEQSQEPKLSPKG